MSNTKVGGEVRLWQALCFWWRLGRFQAGNSSQGRGQPLTPGDNRKSYQSERAWCCIIDTDPTLTMRATVARGDGRGLRLSHAGIRVGFRGGNIPLLAPRSDDASSGMGG